MREFILENLTPETFSLAEIALNNAAALVVAFFIMIVYRLTYVGTAYSRRFNVSIGAIVIVTTTIMGIISNNVALSLGMVGALSIIRFRTAVKDVRDAVYIFWAIAAGIGCGVSQYMMVIGGSVTLFVFLLLTMKTISDNRQLLVVQMTPGGLAEAEAIIDEHFGKNVHRLSKSADEMQCELVYSVKEGALKKADESNVRDITQRLMHIEGVIRVTIVEQQDDIAR
ncbi:MAG: DUF4956 domain-containing protein [Lachnospiraceae bacterium]|nr:DUF4956 domain-containing protein [Lachnospiraceae bacterium]